MTKNGSGRSNVVRPTVTSRSCIACKQRRLRLGRGAVDFVGQQDVGEDRPFDEAKTPLAVLVFFQHVGAGDVRGHQVGRELDAFELHVQNAGQRADHQRLRQPRHALQQAMPAGEDGGEHLLDDLVLPNDDLLQLLLHQLPMLGELLQDIAERTLLFLLGQGGFRMLNAK